jgi:hypothetical protein
MVTRSTDRLPVSGDDGALAGTLHLADLVKPADGGPASHPPHP